MIQRLIIYILFAVVLISCGEYEKILKSSDYSFKYDKAMAYYEEEDYVKAGTLLEQITNVYKGTTKADTVQYYRAMSYFNQRDFLMASHYFQELFQTYPNSNYAEEAAFMTGYCYYELSPRPSLDQENSFRAINTLSLFIMNYPESDKVKEAQRIVEELEEKLVEKSYMNARLYFDLGMYKSAIIALRNSLNQYPDTKYREELMFLILRSNYLLATNSVESRKMERFQSTVDEYYSYIGEFPNGEFSDEAEDIYRRSMNVLGQEIN